jgi:2-keto-4-pentenoate hydratase/2-oxohepta-3-ene-1,7-dioic acid hydratase in catechol pathway
MKKVIYNNSYITPTKIVCIGRNYVEHIRELGNEIPSSMVIFNKPNSAISNELFYHQADTRFEGEISFLIKNKSIVGVGFGLDLTHAKLQNNLKEKGLPWERAKAFDGSAIFSEFVPFYGDITKLSMKLYINNRLAQFGDYELMIYKPQTIIEEIEKFMSLEDGDIIMSGTPKGVGNYNIGDKFRGEIFHNKKLLIFAEWIVKDR